MMYFRFQRLHLKVGLHDKNMVHDNSHHLISHLRQKRERNRTILRMRSREEDPAAAVTEEHHFPKSLSFNLDGTRTVPDHKPSQVCIPNLANTVKPMLAVTFRKQPPAFKCQYVMVRNVHVNNKKSCIK